MRDVRHWLNQVLPSEQYRQTAEPGKKPSIQQAVKGREQRIREEQAEKHQQPRRQQKQDMELNQSGACHFPRENDRRFFYFQEDLPIECI